MAIDKRVETAAEVISKIFDGATIMISGFGGAGFPNFLLQILRDVAPKELTLIANSATHPYSLTHTLIEAKMVKKVIVTAARGRGRELSPFEEQWRAGLIELECVPQGNFAERIRAGGAGIPAFYSPTGFGTDLAKGKETREINGKNCVLQEAINGDFALIRGDRADRFGNVNFNTTQMNFAPAMATACKVTIAEVRETLDEALPTPDVHLPSVYVNHVIATGKEI